MGAAVVQNKIIDKPAVKAAETSTPEIQPQQESETGISSGMPIFLRGAGQAAAATPPTDTSRAGIQRQPLEEQEEATRGCCGTGIQAKLTVGPPDDEYEREADQVAQRVIRAPAANVSPVSAARQNTSIQAKPLSPFYLQRLCAECEEELQNRKGNGPAAVQTKGEGDVTPASSNSLAQAVASPASGKPLVPALQKRIGGVLGADLGHVRIHDDAQAQEAAQSINARAFTHQNHIYLGRGQSQHDTQLLAHEAAHVVQQGAAPDVQRSLVQRQQEEEQQAVATAPAQSDNESQASPDRTQAQTEAQQEGDDQSAAVPVQTDGQTSSEQTTPAPQAETEAEGGAASAAAQAESAPASEAEAAQGEQATSQAQQQMEQQAPAETTDGGGGAAEGVAAAAEGEGGAAAEPGSAADSMARIGSAPDSIFKDHVLAQAELINADSMASEDLLAELAEGRRREVSEQFASVRAGIMGFVENAISNTRVFVLTKQLELTQTVSAAMASAQGAVDGAIQTVEALAGRIGTAISSVIENATSTVQSGVGAIAGHIQNFIHTVPLPDLPGVERVRGMVSNLVNRAAGAVNSALSGVLGIVQRALNNGMNLLNSALRYFRQLINRVFAQVTALVMRLMQTAFQILNAMMQMIVTALRLILNNTLFPLLHRVESRVLNAISGLEQRMLQQLRENRDHHLEILAASLSEEGESEGAGTSDAGEWFVSMADIAQQAVANNRDIINSFMEKTGSFFALLLSTISFVLSQIVLAIRAYIERVVAAIVNTVMRFVQSIRQAVERVISFIQGLIERVSATIGRIVSFVRALIERPIDTLLDFARNTLSRIGSAVRGFVRSLVGQVQSGQLVPITPAFVPAPAPVPIPVPAPPIPAPVPAPIPAPVPAPAPVPIVIIIIIVVIIIVVLIVLLYLLYKWLKKRRRRKPKGKEYHPDTPINVVNSLPARRVDLPAKPGETLDFTIESTDKDKVRPIGAAAWTPINPGLGPYETVYAVSGNASWLAPGSGKTIYVDPKLDSRNITLFIDKNWNGDKITVTASVRDKAMPAAPPDIGTTRDAEQVITWTIVLCEDELTTKTAKNIPTIAPQLNQTTYNSVSLTLLDGSSDTAARSMLTHYLTHEKTGGGPPAGQNNLYGFRKLPTKSAHGGSGYKQTQVFIKGHLLNEGLGGVGQAINLFPITGQANKNHELGPEEDVKQLVRRDGLVVMYSVNVMNETARPIDVFGDGKCLYQYIDAAFACSYATYKYCNGVLEMNTPTNKPIASELDVSGFIANIKGKGGCQES